MVNTRRRSSSSKRHLPSSDASAQPNAKRSKASDLEASAEASSTNGDLPGLPADKGGVHRGEDSCGQPGEQELGSPYPIHADCPKDFDACDAAPTDPDSAGNLASLEPLGDSLVVEEKTEAVGVVLNRARKRPGNPNGKVAWAKLISQCSQNPHLLICDPCFTVGQGPHCNLWLRDPLISKTLCILKCMEQAGAQVTELEIQGGKGMVQVNGKICHKNSKIILNGGDEVVFSSTGQHAYIFQQLINGNLATSRLPASVGILEAQSLHNETISGDHSAFPEASILASLSSKDLIIPPLVAKNGKNLQEGAELSTVPSSCGLSGDCTSDVDMKETSLNDDGIAVSLGEKNINSDAINDNLNLDSLGLDTCMDADVSKVHNTTLKLRPLLQILVGSTPPHYDLSSNLSKLLDGRQKMEELLKDIDPSTNLVSTQRQTFKDSLQQGIINSDDIEVSFERFPYYLSDTTKDALISATYIHLKRCDFVKYTSDLSSVFPRLLLSGPAGSEIYQETLTKALAKYMGARLLIVHSLMLPGAGSQQEQLGSDDDFKEILWSERPSFTKRTTRATSVHPRKPASSVEANITGGSTVGSQALPKQEKSTASSRNYKFKAGDRVEFVGILPSGVSPLNLSLSGPGLGYRGQVVQAVEGNGSSKIGVRFDKSFLSGNNLRGRCKPGHGFYCEAADLRRIERYKGDDVDKLSFDELFEVISNECRGSPLILLLKDMERAIMRSTEAYNALKIKLEKLPENVVVIASHTQMDNRKDKGHPGGVLFTKLGCNQAALLDLAFPDNANKLQDRGKETSKNSKQLSCLFPNEVTIQSPQDEVLLLDWKQQLECDSQILKAQSNISNIRSVLNKNNLECPDLETLSIKDHVVTSESAEKMVGWALSYRSMNSSVVEFKDGKLLMSAESIMKGFNTLQGIQSEGKCLKNSPKDVVTENEFEKRLLTDVVPPNDIGISFDDIGALENVKDTLKELVMLPLQRPELFSKGQLMKPCKGILLFGPPGTGKTMLAKAIATQAGANFINISMSSITSKWFGEVEKYVKAVFSLASKISPCVVFVDEVDSMLGRRERPGENEAMRKMKNEFMVNWDGLRTKDNDRIMVLGATNRPFDLDDAVIRRFTRRLMVGLPDASNREKILRVILEKEEVGGAFDFEGIARLSEGYSGSDLKNLCTAAAHRPIREILDKEEAEKASALADNRPVPALHTSADVRPLNVADFRYAHDQVCASVSSESQSMGELIEWNRVYGEGGCRRGASLSYFM